MPATEQDELYTTTSRAGLVGLHGSSQMNLPDICQTICCIACNGQAWQLEEFKLQVYWEHDQEMHVQLRGNAGYI